jgi:uncharacterized protein (DUF2062 family)
LCAGACVRPDLAGNGSNPGGEAGLLRIGLTSMLFRRRNPLSFGERIRLALWPANGWKRSARYVSKRVMRLSGSPHAIAAGFAAGVFASFTPFIGFHFILSFVVAFLIGGNMLAAAFGTAVGNPLTFPVIWLTSYKIGNFVLGLEHPDVQADTISASLATQSMGAIVPLLQSMTIGGLPLGIAFGLGAYFSVRWIVVAYQRARRQRLEIRRGLSNQRSADAKAREPA